MNETHTEWSAGAPLSEVIEALEEIQDEHPDAKLVSNEGDGTALVVKPSQYGSRVRVRSKW